MQRTESFASLDELRKALVRQSAVCLEKEYVKQSGSSLDELRALWSMVEEDPDELEDLGYRPIITYATAKTSSEVRFPIVSFLFHFRFQFRLIMF